MLLPHRLERPLQAVEHVPEQAGPEAHGQLAAGGGDGLADAQSTRAFIQLHDRATALEAHDLAHQRGVPDRDPLVQLQAGQVDGDRRAGDADDAAVHQLSLTW